MNVKWFQRYGLYQAPGAQLISSGSVASGLIVSNTNSVSLSYALDKNYTEVFISGTSLTNSGTLVGGSGVLNVNNSGINILWTGTFPKGGDVWSGTIINYYEDGNALVSHAETKRFYNVPTSGFLTIN